MMALAAGGSDDRQACPVQYRARDQLELFFRSMRDTKHVANNLQFPRVVDELMHQLGAPLRLDAHLTLVHDVACQMMARPDATWPTLTYDRTAVRLGAALHDIGKIVHREELIQPGHAHEVAGDELLRTHGYRSALARFARAHRQQADEPVPHAEDLQVALADAWWLGERDTNPEAAVCRWRTLAAAWEVFGSVDDLAANTTAGADARLVWQQQFPA